MRAHSFTSVRLPRLTLQVLLDQFRLTLQEYDGDSGIGDRRSTVACPMLPLLPQPTSPRTHLSPGTHSPWSPRSPSVVSPPALSPMHSPVLSPDNLPRFNPPSDAVSACLSHKADRIRLRELERARSLLAP